MKNQKSFENTLLIRGTDGSAILAVLALTIIIGLTLNTAVTRFASEGNQSVQSSRSKWSRNSIAYQIERSASLPSIFRTSLPFAENSDLRNCILGTGATPCRADGTFYPVSLYSAFSDGVGAGTTTTKISGSKTQDNASSTVVLYDNKGQRCASTVVAANSQCPFEVLTSFTVRCPASAATCARAESIRVQYTVRIPQNVLSGEGFAGRMALAQVEKEASLITANSILPPAHNYVPNAINVTTLSVAGTGTGADGSGVTTVQVPLMTSEQTRAEIVRAIGNSDPARVSEITEFLTARSDIIRDASLIQSIAALWSQNSRAGNGAAERIDAQMRNGAMTLEEARTAVQNITAATSGVTDPMTAYHMAENGVYDIAEARGIQNAIAATGLRDNSSVAALVYGRITDPQMAVAITRAVANASMTESGHLYTFSQTVNRTGITTPEALANMSQLIMHTNPNQEVADAIMRQGITNLAAAEALSREMMSHYPPPAPVATVGQPVYNTVQVPQQTTPVSMAAACSEVSSCGTSIGM